MLFLKYRKYSTCSSTTGNRRHLEHVHTLSCRYYACHLQSCIHVSIQVCKCNVQESKRQADFDEALRDARTLRMDLGHEQRRCEGKLTSLIAQQCDIEARCQRLTAKQKQLPRHLKQQAAETEHNVREVYLSASNAQSLPFSTSSLQCNCFRADNCKDFM